ncbi:hypothetical protein F4680DRAFT_421723 [Xylaria scruposa]|nr:hypothetical protein F4680DRAFT_421723 [Xylaria scruposa]
MGQAIQVYFLGMLFSSCRPLHVVNSATYFVPAEGHSEVRHHYIQIPFCMCLCCSAGCRLRETVLSYGLFCSC